MTAQIDELTAYRWARHGDTVCPLCAEEADSYYPQSLSLVKTPGGDWVGCAIHGKLFDVIRAA